jgi:hypothetical protein
VPNLMDLFGEISLFAKLTMAVPIAAFGVAVAYAFRPAERKLVLMRPVSLAAIFATINGLLGGWIAVLGGIAATPEGILPTASMYLGLAESLTVGFVNFGLLAAAWLLVAVGMLRPVSFDMPAAVDPDGFARHEVRLDEKHDGADDSVGPAPAADRRRGFDGA